jgi:hypothetical protein
LTRHTPFAGLALCGAALALSACGGASRASDSSAAAAMTKARAQLAAACQEGSSSALDRRLCACIALEASKREEYDTPAKLDALRRDEDGDHVPSALGQVAMTCADRVGADG